VQYGAILQKIRLFADIDLQSRVLIAGCASGRFARYLMERAGCEMVCLEEHPALVRRARARGLCVKKGTIDDLPDDENKFDVILFIDSLDRMVSPRSELASARKRLASTGRIVIVTASPDASADRSGALFAFTAETMEALLHSAGYGSIRHLQKQGDSRLYFSAIPERR
jgi:SAM-dependent methyltransferase